MFDIQKDKALKYEPFWNEYKEYCSKHNYPIPDELLFFGLYLMIVDSKSM